MKPGGWPSRVLYNVDVADFIPVVSPTLSLWPLCFLSEVCGLEWLRVLVFWRNYIRVAPCPSLVSGREFWDLCSSHFCDVSLESGHRLSLGGLFPRQRQQQIKATVSLTSRFSPTEGKWQQFSERPRARKDSEAGHVRTRTWELRTIGRGSRFKTAKTRSPLSSRCASGFHCGMQWV